MDCKKCGKEKIKVIETMEIHKDGSKHIKLSCNECGAFFMYKQYQETEAFIMPFGKFKGQTIKDIVTKDGGYAVWAAKNISGNIAGRFAKELGIGEEREAEQKIEGASQTNECPF